MSHSHQWFLSADETRLSCYCGEEKRVPVLPDLPEIGAPWKCCCGTFNAPFASKCRGEACNREKEAA